MFWKRVRLAVVIFVVVGSISLFLGVLFHRPALGSTPFGEWYGNWLGVLLATGLFTLFLLGFARPRRRREWRSAGLYTAFLLSLFTEMFGLPLTIFLIAPLLGLSPSAFGANESHLWAYLLGRLGLFSLPVGVYLIMVMSIGLIGAGASLVAVGWYQVYRGKGELVTGGIYRALRHPQYLGLILIVVGFNLQWPTLLTLLMAPVLIVMYVRLARWEDLELATFFGERYLEYARRVPAFIPWGLGSSHRTPQPLERT
jgi:protein-S-isoprenylcysteine O-methyltransferase Ste14